MIESRYEFIRSAARGMTISALCRSYGISRKTAYKWRARFEKYSIEGLGDRKSTPLSTPHSLDEAMAYALLDVKSRFPNWGPRKVVDALRTNFVYEKLPAVSTVGDLFSRFGLTKHRKKKVRHPKIEKGPTFAMSYPNETWCVDFKGHFKMGDGTWCYPLTITDSYSRYILAATPLSGTLWKDSWGVFEKVFRKHGLPKTIHSDNGCPFAGSGISQLTRLNVLFLRLGIHLSFSRPGHPQDNPRHERMHKTMKDEVSPMKNRVQQAKALTKFRNEFNQQRPHEAHNGYPPASVYSSSFRPFPKVLSDLKYPNDFYVRIVNQNGEISFLNKSIFVSEALTGQHIGIRTTMNGLYEIFFASMILATFDEATQKVIPYEGPTLSMHGQSAVFTNPFESKKIFDSDVDVRKMKSVFDIWSVDDVRP